MDEENFLTLIRDLCSSFLTENQRTTISELDVIKLVKSTLSSVFVRFNNNGGESKDAYSLLRTEIIARIIARGTESENNAEEIKKYLKVIEEMYRNSDERDELNSMFLFLYKLSQFQGSIDDVHLAKNSSTSFFSGTFNGSNWSVFHQDPGPVYTAFNYPFYDPPGTGVKLIQDYCSPFEPLSNDFSKIFDGKAKLYRFDQNRPVEPTLQDEGFVTPGSEFSNETDENSTLSDSSAMSTSYSSDEYMFDSQCLKLCKKTWEQLGSEQYFLELPFASERADIVIPLWKIFNASQNPRIKTFSIEGRIQCNFEELRNDLQYLLFGMNSSSFFYNSITKTFYIRDKLHMKTLTPEIVSAMCEPFLQCAAYYYALKTFIEKRGHLPFGPIHQVFCRSLLEILNVYRFSLLNLNWTDIHYVVQLDSLIMPFQRRLQFLTKFCLITVGEEIAGSSFPSGVQLLDYLFTNVMKVFRSDFSCILIHLFEKCCNMYLKILSEWIFEGCFSSPTNYAEFFIEIRQQDELCRDWRRVSCIKIKEKQVPKFLEKFYKDLFICGKSVNLLKIFTRRDVLDTILQKSYPAIKCCFNKSQLDEYMLNWQKFQQANSDNYNTQKKVKDILFKTYDPEFYTNVKRVREAWFTNYESRLKPDMSLCEENSFKKKTETAEKTSESKSSEVETCVEIIEVESEVEPVNKDEKASTVDSQEENPKLKTKRLVEFYEHLNTSSTSPKKTPRRSPKIIGRSLKPIELIEKGENTPTHIFEVDSPSQFSDYKGGSEIGREIKTSTPATKDLNRSEKSMAFNISGGGDFALPVAETTTFSQMPNACGDAPSLMRSTLLDSVTSPTQLSDLQRNRLRSEYSDQQNLLNVTDQVDLEKNTDSPSLIRSTFLDPVTTAAQLSDLQRNQLRSVYSDQQNLLNVTDQVGLEKNIESSSLMRSTFSDPVTTPAQLSDLQRNRLRSVYSDQQNMLNITDEVCLETKTDSSQLTSRQLSQLKYMSSDYLNLLGDVDVTCEKNPASTPLNARDQNKLKVMSSEYHQRLNTQKMTPPDVNSAAVNPPRELSDCERNKLKVMSSEYHLRLLDCVSHDKRVAAKLSAKVANNPNECQLDQHNLMVANHHLPLETVPISPSHSGPSLEKGIDDCTSPLKTASSASAANDTFNTDEEIAEELETVSEDQESEDQVTIVENVVQDALSPSSDSIKRSHHEPVPQANVNDVLNMKKYVSYGPAAFVQRDSDTAACLRAAARSVHDVDRTSLLYYLSQSIAIPLQVQSKIVNDAILRVFIEEEGYLEHLTTLRNYLFLRKSEFCILLTNTMFKMAEKVKTPYLLLNNYTLSCLLQQALLAGNSRESIRFERKLFFVIDDVIPQAFDLQDIKALKCVSLNYSVKWPVNVLITEPIIKKYSRIFKFLMQIQRALWTLKDDFKGLKNLKRGKSLQYTQIQLYRHAMTHVVRILHEFVMREGIQRCWNELVEYIGGSEITLDGLYISHLKYVNKILQRCFLCDMSETCRESVLNLLSSVLQYHAALHAGTWHRNVQVNFLYHTNFKTVKAVFEQFQQHLNDVRTKLQLLVYTKQRLYFEPLLFELSRNNHYNA